MSKAVKTLCFKCQFGHVFRFHGANRAYAKCLIAQDVRPVSTDTENEAIIECNKFRRDTQLSETTK